MLYPAQWSGILSLWHIADIIIRNICIKDFKTETQMSRLSLQCFVVLCGSKPNTVGLQTAGWTT